MQNRNIREKAAKSCRQFRDELEAQTQNLHVTSSHLARQESIN